MRSQSKRKQRGFTLIELGVVVAVIGVLATVVLVGRGYIANARNTKMLECIHNVQTAVGNVLINGSVPAGLNPAYLTARGFTTNNLWANPASGYTLNVAFTTDRTYTITYTCPDAQACTDIDLQIGTDPNVMAGHVAGTAVYTIGN